jgi:outer membrane protein
MRGSGWVIRKALVVLTIVAGASGAGQPLFAQARSGGPEITLQQAIRQALASNRELETARLNLASARGQVREAWSAVYPTIDATATYTRNLDVPGQFLPAVIFDPEADPDELVLVRFGSDNNYFGQLRLEQPLFRAGVFIGLGAAERYERLQVEMVRGSAQEIVTRTKQRYFDVLLAEEAARLNEESVRRVRQALEETQAMQRAGLVGDYDVLRLEVELANLEPALRRALNDAEASRRALAVELAMEDVGDLQVAGSLGAVTVEPGQAAADPLVAGFGVEVTPATALDELIQLARANRSDVRQVELTEDLRRTELRAEQAEYLPQVSFFANYGYSAQSDGGIDPFGWGGRSVRTPQAGLMVTLPVFGGFARPARTDQIRASLAQARTQGSLVAAQVENEIETLFDRVEEARMRTEAQRVAVGQATRGYEIASAQFREGLGTRLELTDAEVALRQSEFNLAQAVHDYLTARAQLDQAVGMVPDVS